MHGSRGTKMHLRRWIGNSEGPILCPGAMPGSCIQNKLNDQEDIMTVKTLEDLFHETLKDLYYAEKKLVKTLPKMAKQAASPALKEAIEHH